MADNRFTGRDEEVAATLTSGGTITAEVDLGNARLVGLRTDATLTPTVLSFLTAGSTGNTTKLRTVAGAEFTYPATQSITQPVDPPTFVHARFIRVQGGTSGAVVTQTTAASTITLIVRQP